MSVTAYGALQEKLRNKKYRDAFVSASVRHRIALQIRALQKKMFPTQRALAEVMHTSANVISRMQDPSYGKLTVSTLLDLASAFDVGLEVKFVKFNDVIENVDKVSNEDLLVPKFDEELEEDLAIQRLMESCLPREIQAKPDKNSAEDYISGGDLGENRLPSFFGVPRRNSAECVL